MSRVGKNPVPIPAGVTIELTGQHLKAKGKRGELQLMVHDDVSVARDGDKLVFA
ncbi:MAG: large subunit ribosomal protein, partial [Alphaproteobacteria bacterium]|nr:large subunit ribosomal protein [Alphaproteobacteria bacterium]